MTNTNPWPPWAQTFLDRLGETGIVTRAVNETGVSPHAVNKLRQTDEEFRVAWDEALERAYDGMEDEMQRRAFRGVDEPVFYLGTEVARVRKYSDKLAMYLMSGYRKKKFAQRSEVSGPDGGPVQVDEAKRAGRVAQLLGLAAQRKAKEDNSDIF